MSSAPKRWGWSYCLEKDLGEVSRGTLWLQAGEGRRLNVLDHLDAPRSFAEVITLCSLHPDATIAWETFPASCAPPFFRYSPEHHDAFPHWEFVPARLRLVNPDSSVAATVRLTAAGIQLRVWSRPGTPLPAQLVGAHGPPIDLPTFLSGIAAYAPDRPLAVNTIPVELWQQHLAAQPATQQSEEEESMGSSLRWERGDVGELLLRSLSSGKIRARLTADSLMVTWPSTVSEYHIGQLPPFPWPPSSAVMKALLHHARIPPKERSSFIFRIREGVFQTTEEARRWIESAMIHLGYDIRVPTFNPSTLFALSDALSAPPDDSNNIDSSDSNNNNEDDNMTATTSTPHPSAFSRIATHGRQAVVGAAVTEAERELLKMFKARVEAEYRQPLPDHPFIDAMILGLFSVGVIEAVNRWPGTLPLEAYVYEGADAALAHQMHTEVGAAIRFCIEFGKGALPMFSMLGSTVQRISEGAEFNTTERVREAVPASDARTAGR